MQARYHGFCPRCRRGIDPGDEIERLERHELQTHELEGEGGRRYTTIYKYGHVDCERSSEGKPRLAWHDCPNFDRLGMMVGATCDYCGAEITDDELIGGNSDGSQS